LQLSSRQAPNRQSRPRPPRLPAKSRGGRSGGLKDRIIALLEGAGAQGLRVKEIADKLGAKGSNIAVWFSTTGKKHATRVSPGVYAAKGGAVVVPAPMNQVKIQKTEFDFWPADIVFFPQDQEVMTPDWILCKRHIWRITLPDQSLLTIPFNKFEASGLLARTSSAAPSPHGVTIAESRRNLELTHFTKGKS